MRKMSISSRTRTRRCNTLLIWRWRKVLSRKSKEDYGQLQHHSCSSCGSFVTRGVDERRFSRSAQLSRFSWTIKSLHEHGFGDYPGDERYKGRDDVAAGSGAMEKRNRRNGTVSHDTGAHARACANPETFVLWPADHGF